MIDDEGVNLGILTLDEALKIGEEGGLDLVEVNPEAQPPVCRLLDYGKLKYQQKKKTHQKSKAQPQQKELRITPKIGEHDLLFKLRQARSFLKEGDKVLITMSFRGREMVHVDRYKEVIAKVVNELADVGKIEKDAKQEGRRLTIVLTPGSSKKSDAPEETHTKEVASKEVPLVPNLAPALSKEVSPVPNKDVQIQARQSN